MPSIRAALAALILAWASVSTAPAQSTLTNILTGFLAVPGERDPFTFNVATNSRFYFDALTNLTVLQWSLSGPPGTPVANRSFTGSDAQTVGDPTVLLPPGDYTLTIQSPGGTTNGYLFRFVNFVDATLLVPGTVVSNSLAPANKTDFYQFTAAAGDRFYFQRISRVGLPNTWWRLMDPYGNQIFSQGFNDVGTPSAPVTLPAAGTYTLLVEGYIGDTGSGTYAFSVVPEGNVPPLPYTGTPLNLGDLIVSNLVANTTNFFIFTLANEARVVFDTQTNSPSLNWTLQGPSGVLVNQRGVNTSDGFYSFGPFDLPAGNYQVRLQGSANAPYRFRLLDLATATPLTPGNSVSNALSPASATDFYRFNAAAGARFFFNNLSLNSLPDAYWRLVDPYNTVVFSAYAGSDQGPLILGAAGAYTLLVEGYWGDPGDGAYSFNVVPVANGLQALTLGSIVTGAITTPGQRQQYTFSLAGPERLYFDSRTNVNLFWSLDGPTGNVINNRGFRSSDGFNIGNPLVSLLAGDYTLSVSGTGDRTGDYQFRLVDLGTAAPFTPGTPVSGTLNPANATDAYQFTLATGGKFFFDNQSLTGLPNTYWRLVDPHGNILFTDYAGNDQGPLTLLAGTYTLLIEGYIGDSGSGNYTFNVFPVADGRQTLNVGSLVTGSITTPGQRQHYTFTLPVAARLYFDSRTNVNLFWSLDGPAGNVINNRGFRSSDGLNINNPLLSLPAGDYTLTILGTGDNKGDYQFRFFDLASAAPLTPGTPVSGTLNPANATDAYQFTVATGGKFFFDNLSLTGLPNAYWRLVDPYGNILFSTYAGSDQGPFTLLAGTYTLLIEGYINDLGSGSFSFNVFPVSDGLQTLSAGSLVTGSITTPGQRQQYTFTLAAAARLYFDSRTNVDLLWSLDGPTGNVLNNRSFRSSDGLNIGNPLLSLGAGDYTLTVSGAGDNTGDYQFRLFDLATAAPLTPGAPVSGALNPANASDAYQFTLGGGGKFFFDNLSLTGLPSAYWRLVDPYGNLLFSTYAGNDQGPLTLLAGTYTLLVEGYINDPGSGSYSFNVFPVADGSQTLALGSLVTGTIATPGQREQYTFSLAAAARLYFDSRTNVGLLWSLDGPTGNVVNNRSFSSSDGLNISNPVLDLPPGSYTLTVFGSGDTASGFQFRLLDFAAAAPLMPGTPVSAINNPANGTDLYRFNASAGDRFFFAYVSSSGIPNAYWRLVDPYDNILFTRYFNSSAGTNALPATGTYTLLIEGSIGDSGLGSYEFNVTFAGNVAPLPFTGTPLPIGGLVSSNLASSTASNAYTFSLGAPSRLYFDALTRANFSWSLFGPAGVVVSTRGFLNSDSVDISNPLLALPAGDYQLVITGDVGLYQFRLLDFASATLFTAGTLVSNTLSPANSTVLYQFTGAAGQQLAFDALTTSGFINQPYARLFAPLGNIILATFINNDVDTFVLPQSGTYTLTVEGRIYDGGAGGNYAFNLLPVSYPTNALAIGSTASGTVSTVGQRQFYTFTLGAAANLYFDALTNGNFTWRLDAPWGPVVNWTGFASSDGADVSNPLLALPAGSYTLTVAGNNFVATGDYRFRLLDFANAALFTPGTVVSNTLSPANSTVLYQFTGAAGQQLAYDALTTSGFINQPYVRLFAPLGNIIMATFIQYDVDTFVLPQSGAYTLAVEGRIYDSGASGNYAFNLVPVIYPTNALTIGSTASGAVSTVGQRQFYTFTLGAAANLYFDALTNGNFSWRLDAPWGPIVNWTAFANSDGADIGNPLLALPAGSYTLTVAGNNFVATGDYRFRLLDFANATAFTPGTVVSNALTPANSTVFYQFTGAAGQQLAFEGLPTSGFNYQPYVRLYSPLGNIIMATFIQNAVDTFVLPQSGTYTLTVEGRIYDGGASGNHSFNLLPVSYPTNTLAIGSTVSGTVSTLSQRHLYTFTLGAPANLYFDALTNANFSWRLDAPWGPIANWTGFANSDGVDIGNPLLALPAGNYTLTVAGNGFVATGDYRFRLLDFADATLFAPGTVVSNTLSPANSTLFYQFTGAAGDRYYFKGLPSSGFTYQPYTRLYAPLENVILAQSINQDADTFSLPQSGTYTITVEGRVFDFNLSGNYSFNLVPNPPVPPRPLLLTNVFPDLIVAAISVSPPSGLQSGDSATVQWTDQNIGSGPVNLSFTDRLTIRHTVTGNILADSTLFYDESNPSNGSIAPGAARQRQLTVRLPDGTESVGVLQVSVTTDAQNDIPENNEANNSSSINVTTTLAPYPDLLVASVGTVPTNRWLPGSVVTIDWRLTNAGVGPANTNWTDGVVVRNTDTAAVLLNTTSNYNLNGPGNGPIAPGEFRDRALAFTMPTDANAYGTFAITITADSANQVFEHNSSGTAELNNGTTITIISAPDLVPVGLGVSSIVAIQSGGTITINWNDENDGTVDTGSGFSDRVVVRNTDTAEELLNTTVFYDPNAPSHGALPPGGSRPRSQTFQLPDGARGAGALQISVTVDTFNQLPEVNASGTGEANNSAVTMVTSSIAPYPDLQIANLTVQPAVLASGTNLTVRWQDTNSGNAVAPGNWYDHLTIVNTNLGLTLLDTTLLYDASSLGPLTNGTARNRSFSFTLPNNSNGAGGLVFTVTADTFNNIFEYNLSGTGESNNTASVVLSSSLTPLADLLISSLTFSNSAFTDQILSARLRLANQGLAGVNTSMVQRVFISTTPVPGSGTLAAQADYTGPLGVGQFIDQTLSLLMPSTPGSYWLIAQADATDNVLEFSEANNFRVGAMPISVQAAYTVTVLADIHSALANTPVPMHGQAILGGSGAPAAFMPVTIHIQVRGTDRTFTVLTGPDGRFASVFHPLPNEAGDYQIAAALPGVANPPTQDIFTLIGMGIAPVGLVDMIEGSGISNATRIDNLSDVPLSGLNVVVVTNQPNLSVSVNLGTNALGGFGSATLGFSITAIDASILQSPVVLRVTSAEGAFAELTLIVRVEPLLPRLVANPASLQSSMQRGGQTPIAFTVVNQGGVATGPLQVVPPSVPWLSLASPNQLPPLAPGSNTVVTVLLTPASDLPLGDYNGAIVVRSTNAALQVPFSFRAVSDANGNMRVAAEDEYTYFAAGSPRVTNALVTLTDALTGVPVLTNRTGADGTLLLSNLTEAFYIVDVQADGHSSFRETALVPAGRTTNVVAFLTRQTVTYSFTVTPTTIPDRYTFTIDSTFETQVPVPVVTIEPSSLDLSQYPGSEFQVLYTVSNHGLIDAEHVNLIIPNTARLQFTALVTNLGKLPANSSLTVPVMVKRLTSPGPAAAAAGPGAGPAPPDAGSGQCSVTAQMLWDYLCGPNVVDKSTAFYAFDSTGCNLVDLYFQVYNLVPDNPPGGGTSALITTQDFVDYLNQFQTVTDFEPPAGYHFQCKSAPPGPPASSPFEALRAMQAADQQPAHTSVCAKVDMRLDQKGVIARDAFKATLEINNELTSSLQNVQMSLQVTDLSGALVSSNFAIAPPDLSGLTAVDGTGTLPGSTVGTANWIIIPTLDAAPTAGFTVYLVGGTLSYTQDGTPITIPLAGAPIQVFPQPELVVRYFHDRDVFADDPFTPQIEPSLPYSLAVQVNNIGHGPAKSLTITGGKPQIVDNVKGLLIDFMIIGTQLENQPVTPALSVDFGSIDPGTNKIARWLFTSSLQGSFTNFSASFSQVDQFGKARLSLIDSVEIHELNHIVDAGGPFEDSRPDFLVNDTPDSDFLPDTLYLSDGTIVPVSAVINGTIIGELAMTSLSVTMTSAPSTGWTYFRFGDPGPGPYRLTRVLRADNSEVPFGTNVWTTDRSFHGGEILPTHTNLVHLLDYNSAGSYTLFYAPTSAVSDAIAPTSAVAALPANSPPNFTVQWSGSDNPGGSGIAFFDIYVAINGGPFAPWITNTTLTAAIYNGALNNTYLFYSRATDIAGNRETAPAPPPPAQTEVTQPGNVPPVITPIPTQTIMQGALFSFTPVATDADLPAETLTWSLLPGAPPAALIAPSTGRINWQTTLADGGTTQSFTLVVTDSGSPSLSATQSFNVLVTRVNSRPAITPPAAPISVDEQTTLSLPLGATDPDLPQQTLTWQLAPGAPTGLSLGTATGLLTWTPTEAQGPGTYVVRVIVRDNGTPSLSDTNALTIVVNEVNRPPVLDAISNQVAYVLAPLLIRTKASDPDIPANTLRFSLDPGAPAGAHIDPASGLFIWMPTRAQVASSNTMTVRVTDNGLPTLSDTKTFSVIVPDYLEAIMGSTMVLAGQTGAVTIAFNATTPVTNVNFTLDAPVARLGDFTLSPPAPPLASATLQQTGPAEFQLNFHTLGGQTLSGLQTISTLSFLAGTTGDSAFVPLKVSGVSALQPNGVVLARAFGSDGRVVFIDGTPLLEASSDGAQLQLTVYAPLGQSYTVQCTTTLTPPLWFPVWTGPITNLSQVITLPATNATSFYRVIVP